MQNIPLRLTSFEQLPVDVPSPKLREFVSTDEGGGGDNENVHTDSRHWLTFSHEEDGIYMRLAIRETREREGAGVGGVEERGGGGVLDIHAWP